MLLRVLRELELEVVALAVHGGIPVGDGVGDQGGHVDSADDLIALGNLVIGPGCLRRAALGARPRLILVVARRRRIVGGEVAGEVGDVPAAGPTGGPTVDGVVPRPISEAVPPQVDVGAGEVGVHLMPRSRWVSHVVNPHVPGVVVAA